jgi:hypothetical protein
VQQKLDEIMANRAKEERKLQQAIANQIIESRASTTSQDHSDDEGSSEVGDDESDVGAVDHNSS